MGELERLRIQVVILEAAIRRHRDYRGENRCWLDDTELYQALPEGYTPPVQDTLVELENCKRYIASRHNPETVYTSPQNQIESLEVLLQAAQDALKMAVKDCTVNAEKSEKMRLALSPFSKYAEALGGAWTGEERLHVLYCEPAEASRVCPKVGDCRKALEALK